MEISEVLKQSFKKQTIRSILISLVLIILAIMIITNPDTVLNTVVIVAGAAILIDGIGHIVMYFQKSIEIRAMSFEFILGVAECALGVYFISNTAAVISVHYIIFGIWIVIESILKIQTAINLKGYVTNSTLAIIVSLIDLLLGIFVILHPYDISTSLVIVTGVTLLISEILNLGESIYTLIQIRKISKNH